MRLRKTIVDGLLLGLIGVAGAGAVNAQAIPWPPFSQSMINGPECLNFPMLWNRRSQCDDAARGSWLAEIQAWRAERRVRIGLDVARYDDPRLKWAQSSYIQPQVMVE